MNQHKNILAAAAAIVSIGMVVPLPSRAIDPAYARKLEKSGCTQATELKGCNINKTKAENAKAGFGTVTTPASTYAGHASMAKTESRSTESL